LAFPARGVGKAHGALRSRATSLYKPGFKQIAGHSKITVWTPHSRAGGPVELARLRKIQNVTRVVADNFGDRAESLSASADEVQRSVTAATNQNNPGVSAQAALQAKPETSPAADDDLGGRHDMSASENVETSFQIDEYMKRYGQDGQDVDLPVEWLARLKPHPLANCFPMMADEKYRALVGSVKKDGLFDAITLYNGHILDGRNRFRACRETSTAPKFKLCLCDPLDFLTSRYVLQRTLNKTQRAHVAAKLANVRHGGDRRSGQHANLHLDRARVAKDLDVSPRSVADAETVHKLGHEQLVKAIELGVVQVSLAAKATALPKEAQREAANMALNDKKKAARLLIQKALATHRDLDSDLDDEPSPPDNKTTQPGPPASAERLNDNAATAYAHQIVVIEAFRHPDQVKPFVADKCTMFVVTEPSSMGRGIKKFLALGFDVAECLVWGSGNLGAGAWLEAPSMLVLIGHRGGHTVDLDRLRSCLRGALLDESNSLESFFAVAKLAFPEMSPVAVGLRQEPAEEVDRFENEQPVGGRTRLDVPFA
jgi:hypothetical protein